FWIFMYLITPFTYLISRLSIAGLADASVSCAQNELLRVSLPLNPSSTCFDYLENYIKFTGGYVNNNAEHERECFYCPVLDSNMVLSSKGIGRRQEGWRNVRIFANYVLVNFLGVFALYWAMLQRGGYLSKKS
ncbi:hypothetical protein K458DRAFT_298665, partial [Lentithecium fluviatile CBS 122367]